MSIKLTPDSGSPSGAAGGMLAGTYPNPTISTAATPSVSGLTVNSGGTTSTLTMNLTSQAQVVGSSNLFLDAGTGGNVVMRPNNTSETARFQSNGFVGIGTAVPAALLDVSGGANGGIMQLNSASGLTQFKMLRGGTLKWSMNNGASGADFWNIQNEVLAASAVSINPANNNVGIGIAIAGAKLEVVGSIKFSGTNSTGAGTPLLATNCPAVTPSAPYTWITAISSDGSTVYIPCWK